MKSISLFIPLLAAALVSAHGYVSLVTIDSKRFTGNVPNGPTKPSIVRQINDVSPVKGASNPFLNCGQNAQIASDVATANPGSAVTFSWNGGDGSNWPHNIGPMLTYMASCGSTPCDKFDSQKAKWFKIDQVGKKADGKTWAQQDLMDGKTASVTIPSTLAPGNYLIRHEIIALHLGTSMGGAEFYPSCSQLTVTGNQKGAPTADELVSLPGAYSDSDPGIFDPTVFNPGAKYVYPGPQIAKFVTDSSSSSGSNPPSSGSSSSDSPSPSPSAPASSKPKPAGSCNLKKKTSSAKVAAAVATYRPRHLSRVMRGIVSGHSH